jgi:hypothetical protein
MLATDEMTLVARSDSKMGANRLEMKADAEAEEADRRQSDAAGGSQTVDETVPYRSDVGGRLAADAEVVDEMCRLGYSKVRWQGVRFYELDGTH